MLKAVIFDLDGVLADSHPIHYRAWKTLLTEQGRAVSDSEMDYILAGRPRKESLQHYLGELPEETMAALGKRKNDLYHDFSHRLQPMAGVLGLMDELEAAGIAMAVATSAGAERTLATLTSFGI